MAAEEKKEPREEEDQRGMDGPRYDAKICTKVANFLSELTLRLYVEELRGRLSWVR